MAESLIDNNSRKPRDASAKRCFKDVLRCMTSCVVSGHAGRRIRLGRFSNGLREAQDLSRIRVLTPLLP